MPPTPKKYPVLIEFNARVNGKRVTFKVGELYSGDQADAYLKGHTPTGDVFVSGGLPLIGAPIPGGDADPKEK